MKRKKTILIVFSNSNYKKTCKNYQKFLQVYITFN